MEPHRNGAADVEQFRATRAFRRYARMLPGGRSPAWALKRRQERAARPMPAQEAQRRVPWAQAIAERWSGLIGDCAERDRIIDIVGRALTTNTAACYSRHFGRFVVWCESQPDRPSPLPANTGTVLRWLAADVTGGKVCLLRMPSRVR